MLECKSREMLDAKFVGLTGGSRSNAEIKCVHSAEQRWVLHSCRLFQSIRFTADEFFDFCSFVFTVVDA